MICAKAFSGLPPTRWVGESGAARVGELFLKVAQLAIERVVLAVADRRRGFLVIAAVMLVDLAPQLRDALGRFLFC